ncbi:MAG: glycosyltransferase family 4 protein [Armatimonadetes bacterium]|nr:glycosyltransferase family 4 protein [Armatimonadota bacterium]
MGPSRPVVVAYADHASEIGGAEISLQLLLRHLDTRLYRPLLLHSRGAPWVNAIGTEEALRAAIFSPESGVFRPQRGKIKASLIANFGLLLRAISPVVASCRALRLYRPVLVHTNTLKCHLLIGLAARLCRLPLIWHLRDIVREPQAAALLSRAAKFLRPTIIAISKAVAAQVADLGLPVRVIYNGVPLEDFRPGPPPAGLRESLGLPPWARILICVARLTPWKGHEKLLRAMPLILSREPTARLIVVGAVAFWSEGYVEELQSLASELGISHAVVWAGHRADVPDLLRLAEVFVLPSKDEPFGRAILEAMATGKPVVAGRTGGVPEICPDGEAGYLVDPDSPQEIADATLALLSDPDRARQMGEKGFLRAQELFDAATTAAQVQNLYHEVLSGKIV